MENLCHYLGSETSLALIARFLPCENHQILEQVL